MKNIKHVLLVCTGNSCRSIMAEAYLRKRFQEEKLSMEVMSAGTLGISGFPPTEEALKVIEREGIETEGYESKPLTEKLIKWADVILVMEPMHRNRIFEMVPESADEKKVYFLGEFNPERGDIVIPDPIGRPLAFYRASFRVIRQSVDGFIKEIKK